MAAAKPTNDESSKILTEEMILCTLYSKVPEFWMDQPEVWFIKLESIFNILHVSEDAKYNLVLASLGKEAILQVKDVITDTSHVNKYNALKEKLLQNEGTEYMNIDESTTVTPTDETPSQLLEQMRNCRPRILDSELRMSWQALLPPPIRQVLSVMKTQDLNQLANIADKVLASATLGEPVEFTQEDLIRPGKLILFPLGTLRNVNCDISRAGRERRDYGDYRSGWICQNHLRYREKANYQPRRYTNKF